MIGGKSEDLCVYARTVHRGVRSIGRFRVYNIVADGVVVQSVERGICDQEIEGSTPDRALLPVSPERVIFTDLRAVMPYGWEDNCGPGGK